MPELSAVQDGFWGGRESGIEDREKNRSEPEGDGRQRSENYEDIEPRSLSQKSRNGSEKKMEGDALHVPGEVKKIELTRVHWKDSGRLKQQRRDPELNGDPRSTAKTKKRNGGPKAGWRR